MATNVVHEILRGLPDENRLSSYTNMPTPVRELIKRYNDLAVAHHRAQLVTDDSTGLDLKKGIENLDAKEIVFILYDYVHEIDHLDDPASTQLEDEDDEKVNGIKTHTIKTLITIVFGFLALFFLLNIFFKSTDPNKSVSFAETVLKTLWEVLKFIIGLK